MTVNIFAMPVVTAFDAIGVSLPLSTLTFYVNNTSTLQDIYSDPALTTTRANPLSADADGRFLVIYLAEAEYRVKHEEEDTTLIWDNNDINISGATTAGVRQAFFFTGDGATTAFDTLTAGIPTDPVSYDISIQGISQKKHSDTYSISGTVVNFVSAPPDTTLVEIIIQT